VQPQGRPGSLLAGATPTGSRPPHVDSCLVAQADGAQVWDHLPSVVIRRSSFSSVLAADCRAAVGAGRQARAVRGGLRNDQGVFQLDRHSGFNPEEAPGNFLANSLDGRGVVRRKIPCPLKQWSHRPILCAKSS
jgi:hypothetical protein